MPRLIDSQGFSFIELMVTVLIISLMAAGGMAALSAGRASWFTAEAEIQVQENLRKALDMVTTELRQSKFSQVTVNTGAGFGGTDTITFSVPVICHSGDSLLDNNADVAHWGATTKFNCRDPLCMDADNSCATVEYKYIRYQLISGNILVRQVLNNALVQVNQTTVANNITNFRAVLPGASLPITITLTAQVTSVLKRPITVTVQNNIIFRNI